MIKSTYTPLADSNALRYSVAGTVIRPSDTEYDDARRIWNSIIDKYPAMIVRCASTADVVVCVNYAREYDIPFSVRGGGHNVAGTAIVDDGMVIDLSDMRGVTVDPEARTARAQGGALIADLDAATQAYGLAAPMGIVSETGIAGLTLGGGLGWLRRKHGLSCDSLISAEIVLADGSIIRASETENDELLWGLRGGGGNFGIVTEFEFQLHPIDSDVFFVGAMYPIELGAQLLPQWRDFMATAPEEVSSNAGFWSIPDDDAFPAEARGKAVFLIAAVHCGDVVEAQRVLKPLYTMADKVLDMSGVYPFTAVQKFYDPLLAVDGLRCYWKSLHIDQLDEESIGTLARYASQRPSPDALVVLWHLGGAMQRVSAEDTAFGDRSAPFLLSLDTTWADPADDADNIAWTRHVWHEMHKYSNTGGLYLNFPGMGEEGEDLVRAAYGNNYERLVALKDKYDPHNLFNMNQNIKPSS